MPRNSDGSRSPDQRVDDRPLSARISNRRGRSLSVGSDVDQSSAPVSGAQPSESLNVTRPNVRGRQPRKASLPAEARGRTSSKSKLKFPQDLPGSNLPASLTQHKSADKVPVHGVLDDEGKPLVMNPTFSPSPRTGDGGSVVKSTPEVFKMSGESSASVSPRGNPEAEEVITEPAAKVAGASSDVDSSNPLEISKVVQDLNAEITEFYNTFSGTKSYKNSIICCKTNYNNF